MRKGAKASPTSLTPFILLSSWFIGLVFSFPSTSLLTRRDWISSLSLVAMSSPKPVRWGIVGLGDVCQKKSGPAFWKCNGSELVAVMRRTPGKAAEFASKVPGGNCVGYETLDDLLQHPGLDAIYVSTRPGTHLDICQKVAAAGKDIYCYIEKPVGRCAQETKEIDRICQAQKLPLYTAYISRAYDRTQVIRQLLREGAIGDRLEQVTYKLVGTGGARDMNGELPWRLDAAQSGGGLIMDVGCHVVDRIDYLCGPMIQVQGSAFNKNSPRQQVEDYVHFTANIGPSDWAAMGNCEGATVECTWDFAPKDPKDACDELRFVGPIGSLKMKGGPADPIQVLDSKGGVVRELAFEFPEHTAQALIQGVTDDLRGVTKADFLSYGDNSIRTQEVIDACLEKYYGGREIGYWARSESWPGRPKNTP